MIKKFTTLLGKEMEIDLNRWQIDVDNRRCEIIEESGDKFIIQNKYGDRFSIPIAIIKSNDLPIIENKIDLSESLYRHYFLDKFKTESIERFTETFYRHRELIFRNRDLVVNKAEYYLLKPSSLAIGMLYAGGGSYSLGSLLESFDSGDHIYYDDFHKGMYLVSMVASPLSGSVYTSTFWSEATEEFVHFDSRTKDSIQFPKGFGINTGREQLRRLKRDEIIIDRQDVAISNLIAEIKARERIN